MWLALVVVIVLIYLMANNDKFFSSKYNNKSKNTNALDIVKERYAKG